MMPDAVFDPTYVSPIAPVAQRPGWRPTELAQHIRSFYRHRIAWAALAISSLVLIYGGGAVMFWYHSILLGEGGPAISPALHWFIDSSVGLVALTPVLALIMPVAARFCLLPSGEPGAGRFALAGGLLFALATTPGPVMHDTFVGRGTWLADQVTKLFGDGRALPPTQSIEVPVSMALQLGFGIPVYIVLMWLSLVIVRTSVGRWRHHVSDTWSELPR
ncbi:hypothetical protein Rhe02_15390 [Rhizocola hellebori]|uniref:Uncharacterized protein n=1 Tax=Rhizocola hellebori TaxID=1392758 RepID=A0A8J3Q529_9ACTN|nr:hypothetical protein [Rhizocola hellebori]GIH03472.1 hypothetical protein Rhe02_15390 [Rhizocola hellebori]